MTAHPVVAQDAKLARRAARLGTEYFLRTAQIYAELAGGDLLQAVILAAILLGNVSYLDRDPQTVGDFDALDEVPSDDLRRPVSIRAIAASLSLPYETTRRHVGKLIKAGICVRVRGGVIAPSNTVAGSGVEQDMLTNMGNLRRLVRGLKLAGVEFD